MINNLGNHEIGGYVEKFSSNTYFCRYCYITKSKFDKGKVSGFSWRTKDSYDSDVETCLMTGDHGRGVKSNSILNSLSYYHVASPGLPPCLGHDLYKGAVMYDLMLAKITLFQKRCYHWMF